MRIRPRPRKAQPRCEVCGHGNDTEIVEFVAPSPTGEVRSTVCRVCYQSAPSDTELIRRIQKKRVHTGSRA